MYGELALHEPQLGALVTIIQTNTLIREAARW